MRFADKIAAATAELRKATDEFHMLLSVNGGDLASAIEHQAGRVYWADTEAHLAARFASELDTAAGDEVRALRATIAYAREQADSLGRLAHRASTSQAYALQTRLAACIDWARHWELRLESAEQQAQAQPG